MWDKWDKWDGERMTNCELGTSYKLAPAGGVSHTGDYATCRTSGTNGTNGTNGTGREF